MKKPLTSIQMAVTRDPAHNFALVSVPGDYAAAEAMKALRLGMDVMMFSDNVSVESELALKQFAQKKNSTPAQLSLAWLLAQKPWIVPIPGTTKVDHLLENVGAIAIQLTPEDLREIETALSGITIHGGE